MADSASILEFLNNYDTDKENTVQTKPMATAPSSEGSTSSTSILEFLNNYSSSSKTNVTTSLDDEDEDDDIVDTGADPFADYYAGVPVADDPNDLVVEPEYELVSGRRLASVNEEIEDTNAYLEGLSTEERAEFEEQLAEDIAKGSGGTMRDASLIDLAMSKIPTNWLLGAGNFFNKAGAITVDGMESAFDALPDRAFDGLAYAISVGGRYRIENPRQLADFIADGSGSAGEFLETIPALGNIQGAINTAVSGGTKITAKGMLKNARREAAETVVAQRNNPEGARLATMQSVKEAVDRAANIAGQNRDIAQDLILDFEINIGARNSEGVVIDVDRLVSRTVNGELKLDGDRARKVGKDTLEEITERDGDLFDLNVGDNLATSPILNPEKFNGIVALASDYKKGYPDDWDTKKTTIDNLFELTVNKKLVAPEVLLDELNKYGLSFEDYALTIVGSGSQAGRTLGKLSQLGRNKPKSIIDSDAAKKKAKDADAYRQFIMRVENVRRGGLVSQIATASRNLMSGGIRAPMEALGNVMDEAILAGTKEGTGASVKKLFSRENWRDSFAGMRYMFSRPDLAKGYGDLILEQPELAKQFDNMFNSLNEIQKVSGRGSGTKVDKILTEAEDFVSFINGPNRLQEFLIRRGQFFGELERLVRREYKIDLIDTLNDGKLKDLMNDASSVRPKDAPSFNSLVEKSVNKALDVTYAKQPEIETFRNFSNFITRNGLTVVIPFPRFMFNSMELMGQYAGGASIPLTKKVASIITRGRAGNSGPLTEKDRQRISRNMMGMAAVGAAYKYRTEEGSSADFEQISVGADAQMDTTAVFPMAQFMYLGEQVDRIIKGTFLQKFDKKEFVELFTGSNFRTGVGTSILEEVAALAGSADLTKGEAVGRQMGRVLGNYLGTWAVPLGQIIDAERAAGIRSSEFKDVSSDPQLSFGQSFTSNVSRSLRQRGIGVSREEDYAAKRQVYPFYSNGKERLYPWMKFGGFTITNKPDEDGEYLKRLGFNWREFGSRSKVPTIKRFEQGMLNSYVSTITEIAREQEASLRKEYLSSKPIVQEEFSEDEYVSNKLRPLIQTQLRGFKDKIREGSIKQGDEYARAVIKYRRITPQYRTLATTDFVGRFDRIPDPLDAGDLNKLIVIAKKYSKAYR